ncbi:MAG TPA: TadE family protein [Gemmatimonadales bacterium]|jgi:Flp pilus assembly protein TadG
MKLIQLQKLWRREEGQALAEFALVLPVLFFLIAGIIEFGRGWNIKQAVTDAAREGARWAVVQDATITSTGDVAHKVKLRLALANIDTTAAKTTVTVTPAAQFHVTGQDMTVTVKTKYKMGFLGALLSWTVGASTITIGSQTTMRNE